MISTWKKLSIKQTSPFLQQNEKKNFQNLRKEKELNQLLYVCHEKNTKRIFQNI